MARIGPYLNLPVSIHEWDPDAARVAEAVAAMVRERAPSIAVEHVGSTSVPGCAGKGNVDLMVTYPPGALEAAKRVLSALGFQPQSNRDPFPETRPMRVGTIEYSGKTFRLHAHVIVSDADEAAEFRSFRDRLRASPELTAAYVARKREILAAGVSDAVDYSIVKGKGKFVEQVLGIKARG